MTIIRPFRMNNSNKAKAIKQLVSYEMGISAGGESILILSMLPIQRAVVYLVRAGPQLFAFYAVLTIHSPLLFVSIFIHRIHLFIPLCASFHQTNETEPADRL
ncbi:hypothetical protein F4824DRAFT_269869 [Ustulina deusta]|nr:hypothetical protein F4824DRAFT_269869 [Ustulina deusta]